MSSEPKPPKERGCFGLFIQFIIVFCVAGKILIYLEHHSHDPEGAHTMYLIGGLVCVIFILGAIWEGLDKL
jgi:hypothetical protein